jgi:uncharacterized membrane protein YcaP (DUF421 family)
MEHLWMPDISIAEKLVRSAAVYFFLLLVIRLAGKRQVAQMTPFDLVVLLLISNVVQNAVIGNDNSLGGGFIGVVFILLLNALVAWAAYRSKLVGRVVDGEPTLLVHNGVVMKARMERERVTLHDLQEAMREHGLADIAHVRYAVLEPDGKISILTRHDPVAKTPEGPRP